MADTEAPDRSPGPGVDRLDLQIGPACVPAGRGSDPRQPLHCSLSWQLVGPGAEDLDGEFHLRLFAQAVGRRFSCLLGQVQTPVQPGQRAYTLGLLVPPGSLPGRSDHPDHPGLYGLTAVLQYRSRDGSTKRDFGAAVQQQVSLS